MTTRALTSCHGGSKGATHPRWLLLYMPIEDWRIQEPCWLIAYGVVLQIGAYQFA